MELLVIVEIVQAHQEFSNDDGDVFLWDQAGPQQVPTAPTGAKLHDDPEVGSLEIGTMILGDVRRAELR